MAFKSTSYFFGEPYSFLLARKYASGYLSLMNNILRTEIFDKWLVKLKDNKGKARIIERIRSAERRNFGDCGAVGEGVSEMRIHCGPGYRVYFTMIDDAVYILLCGGTKRRQKQDIDKAKDIARLIKGGKRI